MHDDEDSFFLNRFSIPVTLKMRRDVVSAPALDCFLLFTFTLAREQKERAACVYDTYVQWEDIPSLRACNRSVVIWTCVHGVIAGLVFWQRIVVGRGDGRIDRSIVKPPGR